MLDYLQRPRPESKEELYETPAPMEPLHIRLAKKKGKNFETEKKKKTSVTSLS